MTMRAPTMTTTTLLCGWVLLWSVGAQAQTASPDKPSHMASTPSTTADAPADAQAPNTQAPNAQPTDAQKAEARALYEAGSAAYAKGRYDVAIEAFRAALAITERPALLFALAQTHRLQYFAALERNDLDAAVTLFQRYVAIAPAGTGRDHATEHLAVLLPLQQQARLQDLQEGAEKERPARIIVSSTTPGAMGQIAGQGPAQELPAAFEVPPGPHDVLLTAPQYVDATVSTVAVAGASVAVTATLQLQPAVVTLEAPVHASVVVNRESRGTGSMQLSLPPGEHDVWVGAHGRTPFSRRVRLAPGERVNLQAPLPFTLQTWAGISASAAGGALALTAAVPLVWAVTSEIQLLDLETQLATRALSVDEVQNYQQLGEQRTWAATATIALAAGGAAVAAVGAGLLLTDSAVSPQE